MTGAIFTKIGLGIGLFTLFFVFGVGFLVHMGNEYNIGIEDRYQNTFSATGEFIDINDRSIALGTEGGVDSKTSDIAQVQGALSAAQNQLSYTGIIRKIGNDLINIFPYDPIFNTILFSLLAIMLLAGIIYVFIGRIN